MQMLGRRWWPSIVLLLANLLPISIIYLNGRQEMQSFPELCAGNA